MALDAQADRLTQADAARRERRSGMQQAILLLSRVWSWVFLVMLLIYFSAAGTGFFSLRNSQNILVASVPIILMGLGQTFVIISGGIDLSIGWVMGLSSVISALIMRDIIPDQPVLVQVPLAFAAGLAVAAVAGLINGLITAKLHVPPFIVTLGVSFVARGVAWVLAEGNVVGGQPPQLRSLGNESLLYYVRGGNGGLYLNLGGLRHLDDSVCTALNGHLCRPNLTGAALRGLDRLFTWPVVITFIVLLILAFVLSRTQFGRHTYAIGGNREASIRAGVPVDRHVITLYVLSALTAGLAGVLHTARFSGGAADSGDATMFTAIAAVVMGGVSLLGGAGRVAGTLVGALILAVLETGLVMVNVQTFYKYIVIGIIVVVAVLMDQARDLIVGRAESAGQA